MNISLLHDECQQLATAEQDAGVVNLSILEEPIHPIDYSDDLLSVKDPDKFFADMVDLDDDGDMGIASQQHQKVDDLATHMNDMDDDMGIVAQHQEENLKQGGNDCKKTAAAAIVMDGPATFNQQSSSNLQALLEEQVHQVLEILDDDIAVEYREAMQHVPELVKRETPIRHFLRVEDNHIVKAATRLALRWKCRKRLFGNDRWLLPMIGTGSGALKREYVEFLRTGCDLFVFPPQDDEISAPVFLTDRSRVPAHAADQSSIFLTQIGFYLCTIYAEVLSTRGARALYSIHSGSKTFFNQTDHLDLVHLQMSTIPCKVHGCVVAKAYEPARVHLVDYFSFRQQSTSKRSYGTVLNNVEEIAGHSLGHTLALLENRGYHRSAVPRTMGGDFDYNAHVANWIRCRISLEDPMGGAPPVQNQEIVSRAIAKAGMSFAKSKKPSRFTKEKTLVVRSATESEKEFRQRRNKVYGQRFADRRKKGEADLERKHRSLQAIQTSLKEEGRRLEGLLAAARYHAAVYENSKKREM